MVFASATNVLYAICQKERGKKTALLHVQGYVRFRNAVSMSAFKIKLGCDHAHVGNANGTDLKNQIYCTKEDTREDLSLSIEVGEPQVDHQGERTDLESYRDSIIGGDTDAQLLMEHLGSVARYPHMINFIRGAFAEEALWLKEVICIIGPPGSGKTRYAYSHWPDLYRLPIQQSQTLWFDKFNSQETVLIDEFHGSMSRHTLMQITDRYPIWVPVKGSFVQWNPRTIVFTSYEKPEDWYDWQNSHGDAWSSFNRRITRKLYMEDGNCFDFPPRPAWPLFNRPAEQGHVDYRMNCVVPNLNCDEDLDDSVL